MKLTLPCNFGDYHLLSLIGERNGRIIYDAIQISTSRKVILEMSDPDHASRQDLDTTLAEVRAKAAVEFPLFMTVYEARQTDGIWFFSSERPEGENLAALIQRGETLSTHRLLELLQTICHVEDFLNQGGYATQPLSTDLIYMDQATGNFRLLNPLIPGKRDPEDSNRDMIAIGGIIPPLIMPRTPGATRMNTIATWMRSGQEGRRLTWDHIKEMVATVKDQLQIEHTTSHAFSDATPPPPWYKNPFSLAICAIIFVSAIVWVIYYDPEEPDSYPQEPRRLPFTSDHTGVEVMVGPERKTLICDAHEVTIGAYSRFLQTLANMPENSRGKYDHPDQPENKKNHIPPNWSSILKAAQQGLSWKGYAMSLKTPVFNVDFWDAWAYATWKGYRLPTQDEWEDIASQTRTLAPGGDPLGPVDYYRHDVDSSNNLCGMVSGMSEWTSSMAVDPAMPMEAKRHVICGGNSLSPGKQKIRYERPDFYSATTGFRTVHEPSSH